MNRDVKLNTHEKIKAWLDLCDFSFELLKRNLSRKKWLLSLIK
jgi:hypothetical protein